MQNNKNSKALIYRVLAVILGLVAMGCIIWCIRYWITTSRAKASMEELKKEYAAEVISEPIAEVVPEAVEEASEAIEEPVEPKINVYEVYGAPQLDLDFEGMQQEVCSDIYAWINIPGTAVDYPVVQHPTITDYYLEYNLDGTKGLPGGIYTQIMNSKDWSDKNTVIYGHNMKNGTMFHSLHRYEDSEFFEENRYIFIYTPEEVLVYEIFAAYEHSDEHLLLSYDFSTDSRFQNYLDGIRLEDGMNNNFNDDIELSCEDKIITLSTCIKSKATMRYLVQGKLIDRGERILETN